MNVSVGFYLPLFLNVNFQSLKFSFLLQSCLSTTPSQSQMFINPLDNPIDTFRFILTTMVISVLNPSSKMNYGKLSH